MSENFSGYYLKHQKGDEVLCLIVGRAGKERFIQVITPDFSRQLPFTKGCRFSPKGVELDLHAPGFSLTGRIRYRGLTPIRYDIMGPFKFFPMECRHKIISMNHSLHGRVTLNGKTIDFTGGKGYIEGDSGCSFPSSYLWLQANDFEENCSVMAAVAEIPFAGIRFKGCIGIIQYEGKEYRFATYLGVKILACGKSRLILKQGNYQLEVRIKGDRTHSLQAPRDGKMARTIHEAASCPAEFWFYRKEKLIFHLYSRHTGFEYEGQ